MIYYARRAGIGFNIVPIAREIEASIHDPDFQTWADRLAARIAFIYRRDFFTTLAFILVALGEPVCWRSWFHFLPSWKLLISAAGHGVS